MRPLTLYSTLFSSLAFAAGSKWTFVNNGTTGVVALEMIVVSPTLALIFNRASNDQLQVNGHSAWGALYNLETNTPTALDLKTNSFCASGGFLSNGTMVSIGGTEVENPDLVPDGDGRMGIRILEPCHSPTGKGCTVFEDTKTHHLAVPRWYTTAIRIFDGSLLIAGGAHEFMPFYNTDPETTYEFFPKKDGGVPRQSAFLKRILPMNFFPRVFALPDGKVFIVANNRSVIYDVERNIETPLPDIPNGIRVTYPMDGTATLLPLSPPHYVPEVLVCGGSATDDDIPNIYLSSQTPASDQCSRITLTPEGIKRGWIVETMPERRTLSEMILLPNGQVVITNGASTGYAAFGNIRHSVDGASNADHPVLRPSFYTPTAAHGHRFSNPAELPEMTVPRMYHSTASLTPMGNIILGGSNPNSLIVHNVTYSSEYRVTYLNPPYMYVARPKLLSVPKKIMFNTKFTIPVSVPHNLEASSIKVSLMDLGFSTHAFHSSSRLVFLDAELSGDKKSLTITGPPNNRIYPPGPGWIFLTVDDVSSMGEMAMVGTGASPPVPDQGVRV